MRSEFKALGLNMRKRVSDPETVLEFLHSAFDNDVVQLNDQEFLFRPRPSRPPILVGGAPPHAIERAAKFGDGWLPMRLSPEQLKPWVEQYRQAASEAGKEEPEVVAITDLSTDDEAQCRDLCGACKAVGVTTLVHSQRYDQAAELIASMDVLASCGSEL
ncbi:MAG: LLM class flavin-dependent oxidoreductase [Porticoccaceae bacterium]|nr:LLM class flavin-dependent oxidoreductase [Porticoccaceae bacterium]